MGVLLQAQIEGISTRKDKTIKVTLGTQELSSNKAGELVNMQNDLCHVYVSNKPIESQMIEEIDKASIDVVDNIKSQSKRLKSVFYLLWKQNQEGYEDSEMYYRNKMENVINYYKGKLNEA